MANSDPHQRSVNRAKRLGRRERVFLIIAAVSAVVAIVSVAASLFVRSPAQQAADTAPPAPTALLAPVRSEILQNSVAIRGTVVALATIPVRADLGGAEPSIITGINKVAGDQVREGDVLAQISGRPIIALWGSLPSYRDLSLKSEGPDVLQLETALARLGYLEASAVDSYFGRSTQAALSALYKDRGSTLEATDEISLPFNEVLYVGSFPAQVVTVDGAVGELAGDLDGPLLTLQGGQLIVRAVLPSGTEAQISVGLEVIIYDDVRRLEVTAKVSELGEFTTGEDTGSDPTAAVSASGYPMLVIPDEPLPAEWFGRDVRIVVTIDQTSAPVLVVPVAALSSSTDGTSFIMVQRSGDSEERVEVTVGLVAAGEAAIEPVEAGTVSAGDMVIIG